MKFSGTMPTISKASFLNFLIVSNECEILAWFHWCPNQAMRKIAPFHFRNIFLKYIPLFILTHSIVRRWMNSTDLLFQHTHIEWNGKENETEHNWVNKWMEKQHNRRQQYSVHSSTRSWNETAKIASPQRLFTVVVCPWYNFNRANCPLSLY